MINSILNDLIREVEGVELEIEEKKEKILEKEKKVGLMMGIITLLFIVVYLPGVSLRLMYRDVHVTKPLTTLLFWLISWLIGIIDPVLYIIFQEKYQNEIKNLLQILKPKRNKKDLVVTPTENNTHFTDWIN